jgi:hypothetical protein
VERAQQSAVLTAIAKPANPWLRGAVCAAGEHCEAPFARELSDKPAISMRTEPSSSTDGDGATAP